MKPILLALLCLGSTYGQPLQGSALLKTQLMFVGAHPDDETGVAATLARYAGEGKTVACVYATRGEGGGNMVGTQGGRSLGILREAELKACLQKLGVRHLYFLDEEDFFYTESLWATLVKWEKEEVLEKLVRVIRALRPDVVLTMNPAPSPGQHGHHQAAGILAVEAFSAAADPTRFPRQISHEGLEPWQIRKLYFGGGGDTAVKISVDQPLANGRIPGEIAGEALSEHRSQGFGGMRNSQWLRRPGSFVLARTAVQLAGIEQDLVEGVESEITSAAQARLNDRLPKALPFGFISRPAIERYYRWAESNQVRHASAAFAGDLPVIAGRDNLIELTSVVPGATVSVDAPGWSVRPAKTGKSGARWLVTPPPDARADAEIRAVSGTGVATAKLHPVPFLSVPKSGTQPIAITPAMSAQGKSESEADSSGSFKLAYNSREFRIELDVLDDLVVSNIEPNDIKGHWRSDSVEICIDPSGGAEDTLRSFKLGVFPFDSTGKVRAARDADQNQGPIERTAPGVTLTSEKTPTGYKLRVTIPWSELGQRPSKGKIIGFNILIYDGDKKDAAPGENINESRLAWSPRAGVQGRPEDWGRIIFE